MKIIFIIIYNVSEYLHINLYISYKLAKSILVLEEI